MTEESKDKKLENNTLTLIIKISNIPLIYMQIHSLKICYGYPL